MKSLSVIVLLVLSAPAFGQFCRRSTACAPTYYYPQQQQQQYHAQIYVAPSQQHYANETLLPKTLGLDVNDSYFQNRYRRNQSYLGEADQMSLLADLTSEKVLRKLYADQLNKTGNAQYDQQVEKDGPYPLAPKLERPPLDIPKAAAPKWEGKDGEINPKLKEAMVANCASCHNAAPRMILTEDNLGKLTASQWAHCLVRVTTNEMPPTAAKDKAKQLPGDAYDLLSLQTQAMFKREALAKKELNLGPATAPAKQ